MPILNNLNAKKQRYLLVVVVFFSVLAVGVSTTLLQLTFSPDEAIDKNWRDLMTRCREAIETGRPIDTSGLKKLDVSERTQKTNDSKFANWQLFSNEEKQFVILDAEYQTRLGFRRICHVNRPESAPPLSKAQIAQLTQVFLYDRLALLADQSHKIYNGDPIFPMVMLGFRLDEKTPNNCKAVTAIAFDPDNNFFARTGEQSQSNCGGPSVF